MKEAHNPIRQEFYTNNLRNGCHRVEFYNNSKREFSETETENLIKIAEQSFSEVRPKVILDRDCELRTLAVFVKVDIRDTDVCIGISFAPDEHTFQSSRFTLGNSKENICEYLLTFGTTLWPFNQPNGGKLCLPLKKEPDCQ